MKETQLQFKLEDNHTPEVKMSYLENQVLELSESLNKTRRSLFAKFGDLQKSINYLRSENMELKRKLCENDPTFREEQFLKWTYLENDYLFEVKSG